MPDSRPEAVLLVDDDDNRRLALSARLRELGYQHVYDAAAAGEALALLTHVRPSVVLTDMNMEHSRAGLEVVEAARRIGAGVALLAGSLIDADAESFEGVRTLSRSSLRPEVLKLVVSELLAEARAARYGTAPPSR